MQKLFDLDEAEASRTQKSFTVLRPSVAIEFYMFLLLGRPSSAQWETEGYLNLGHSTLARTPRAKNSVGKSVDMASVSKSA